jgi:hypothetical protein
LPGERPPQRTRGLTRQSIALNRFNFLMDARVDPRRLWRLARA